MNVYDYIKNYAEAHKIENYSIKSKYINKDDAANVVQASGGVCFFYKIFAEGEIAALADLSKKFLEVDMPGDWYDLSPVVEIVDFGTIQKVETDFIFVVENTANFKLYEGTADAMFTNMVNFCAQYIYLIPLAKEDDKNKKIKVKVDY